MTTKKATHADTQEAPTPGGTQDAKTSAAVATTEQPAVVSATQAPAPRDEHTGKGGLYTVKNGQRVLEQRTAPEPEKAKA